MTSINSSLVPSLVTPKALSADLTVPDGYFCLWADMRVGLFNVIVAVDGLLVVLG